MPRILQTATEVVEALGNTGEVAKLVGLKPPAISRWKEKNAIPAYTYLLLKAKLARLSLSAPASLWGMRE